MDLISAIGGLISTLIRGENIFLSLIGPIISTLIGWIVWSPVVYVGETADIGEMTRVVGFAYAPKSLGLLSFILCVGWLISLGGMIWSLVVMVVAIQHGLDVDLTKALITALIG